MRRPISILLLNALLAAGLAAQTESGQAAEYKITVPARDELILAATAQAVLQLDSTESTVCIGYQAGRLEMAVSRTFLANLHDRRPIVPLTDCPKTYARMFVVVDSLGRPVDPPPPPGYVDPLRMFVEVPVLFGGLRASVQITVWQGLGETTYRCIVSRPTGDRIISCRVESRKSH